VSFFGGGWEFGLFCGAGKGKSDQRLEQRANSVRELIWNNLDGEEIVKVKVRPLHDRIVVRRIEEEEKTKGGIIIPDTAKEKPQEGKVIAVGDGKLNEKGERIPLDVKKNDRVLFGKY